MENAAPAPATSAPAAAVTTEAVTPVSQATSNAKDASIGVKASVDTNKVAAPDWTESFRPEQKDYVMQKGFKDPGAILDSYVNLEKLRGVPQDRLLKLPESPEADGWQDVYTKLGKPVTPEGYGLQVPEGVDPGFTNWAKDAFHKMNLSTTQAKGLIEKFTDYSTQMELQAKDAHTEAVKKQEMDLRKDWGAAYHQNVANAQRAAQTFGLPDTAIKALEQAIGFDGVMKFMSDIGGKIGEHGFVAGGRQQGFGEVNVLTPDQAKARIQTLKRDHDFVKKYAAGDSDAVNKLNRLHQMAYLDE